MKALPCVYTDNDDETNKLDRLADNRVQEFSLWDSELLNSELASLNLPFVFDLGSLNFSVEMPSFEVPGAPSPDEAQHEQSADPEKPFITAQDIAATVHGLDDPDYLEVLCDQCGNRLFVKK